MDREEARFLLQSQIDHLKSVIMNYEGEMLWKEEELRRMHQRLAELEYELGAL